MPRRFDGRIPYRRIDKGWLDLNAEIFSFTGNLTTILAAVAITQSLTVMRTIGSILIHPTSAPAAGDQCFIGIGIAKVSSDARAAGAASMPDPIGDPSYPWLWNKSFPLISAGVLSDNNLGMSMRFDFDSKTMRKFKADEDLVVLAQYVDNVGTPPVSVGMGFFRFMFGN